MPKVRVEAEIYEARRGLLRRKQWRARIVSSDNGNIMLVTPEGYNNYPECEGAVLAVNPDIRILRVDA